jgi:hypothetical protein
MEITMTNIRVLNEAGIEKFRAFLLDLKQQPTLWPPPEICADLRYTESAQGNASVSLRGFRTKLEFGNYITKAVESHVPDRVLRTSAGLWAWLTLFYLDQVCPADGNGRRKVLRLEKYIASAGHIATGLDKHLLYFPWKMTALHGEDAAWLLSGPLREDTKVVRELANSYRRNVSTPFLRLAKALYFDDTKGRVKTGATTNKPGSLRRLDRVVNQLDLTYDVFGIEADNLAALLPRSEFRRWLPSEALAN